MTKRLVSIALLLLTCSSCSGLLNPEAGFPVPQDPGTVIVRVSDQAGAPVPDVAVEVSQIPNNVGTYYSVGVRTGTDGLARFSGIPAGSRRVSMTLPAGFLADADGLARQVDVIKSASVTIEFRLIRL